MEEVRQQHLKTDIAFLVNELNVASEQTAQERVYFVSAKEVVAQRMQSESDTCELVYLCMLDSSYTRGGWGWGCHYLILQGVS